LDDVITVNGNRFFIRLLKPDDENLIQELCERCPDYFMIIEGKMPEKSAGHEILFDLPPGKKLSDKFVFGVFNISNILVAVIDLVRDYKVAEEWILGLLLIDPNERGNGLGRHIHEYIKDFIRKHNGNRLRIGVAEENTLAMKFWTKAGYAVTDTVKATYGIKEHNVIVMNLSL